MRPIALLLILIGLSGCASPSSLQSPDQVGTAQVGADAGADQPATSVPAGEGEGPFQMADKRLAELREKFSFPIFIPTRVPEGLEPRPPMIRNDRLVGIAYLAGDLSVGVSVTVGPEGCCLDADPRKYGGDTPVRGGIPATYIPNQPEFGGPILWWNEDGAYIALSGPQLTEEDLVEIAESLSSAAMFSSQ